MKILAVASAGGHWIQLLRLMPAFEGNEVIYVSTKKSFASMVKNNEFKTIDDVNRKDKFDLLRSMNNVFIMLREVKPDVIITTGAAPGLITLILGRFLGSKTIWIDSIANVEKLSMSGKIASLFAHHIYTQWPDIAKGKVKFSGNILS